jgi:hypothetical protein
MCQQPRPLVNYALSNSKVYRVKRWIFPLENAFHAPFHHLIELRVSNKPADIILSLSISLHPSYVVWGTSLMVFPRKASDIEL